MMKKSLSKKSNSREKSIKLLNKVEIKAYLGETKGWNLDGKKKIIFKEFEFKDFSESVDFVNKVSKIAEKEDHHPDIHIFYNKVFIGISTHSIGGLSEKDFILGLKINASK